MGHENVISVRPPTGNGGVGHGGAVEHGPLDVVDAYVVAEDGARVRVPQLDGRAREADERGVRQRVAHVPREAVDEGAQ